RRRIGLLEERVETAHARCRNVVDREAGVRSADVACQHLHRGGFMSWTASASQNIQTGAAPWMMPAAGSLLSGRKTSASAARSSPKKTSALVQSTPLMMCG